MQWSQLKKRLEATFASSVQGRVEIWATRYRHAHDKAGEAWITLDKKRVVSMGTWTYELESAKVQKANSLETDSTDVLRSAHPTHPGVQDHHNDYADAANEADQMLQGQGIYPLRDAYAAFSAYLNLSIEEILASDNPLIRSLGMLDKRFGKRRLKTFDHTSESVLVKKLYECRCLCEGMEIPEKPSGHTAP